MLEQLKFARLGARLVKKGNQKGGELIERIVRDAAAAAKSQVGLQSTTRDTSDGSTGPGPRTSTAGPSTSVQPPERSKRSLDSVTGSSKPSKRPASGAGVTAQAASSSSNAFIDPDLLYSRNSSSNTVPAPPLTPSRTSMSNNISDPSLPRPRASTSSTTADPSLPRSRASTSNTTSDPYLSRPRTLTSNNAVDHSSSRPRTSTLNNNTSDHRVSRPQTSTSAAPNSAATAATAASGGRSRNTPDAATSAESLRSNSKVRSTANQNSSMVQGYVHPRSNTTHGKFDDAHLLIEI